jgi:putative PIN family toxin of toxin-antitoxin system
MSLRAVFDTNILISASVSLTGAPFRCLALARADEVESVTCHEILDEFREKLVGKFSLSPATAALAVDEVKKFSRVVAIPGTLTGVTVDPDDHKVLECAMSGTATHVVTGDKRHLLPLGQYQGIPIVTAADFLQAVSESK